MWRKIVRKFEKWLYSADISFEFAVLFRFLVPSYAMWFAWNTDWKLYSELAKSQYHPPGLFPFEFPSLNHLYLTIILLTLAACGTHVRSLRLISWIVLTICFFLLDGWHNGFGFIDAQIHAVWFALLMIAFEFGRKNNFCEITSFAYRMMEVIYVMVYFQAGISKLLDSGWQWADGMTLQVGMFRQQTYLGLTFAHSNIFSIVCGTGSLLIELLFPLYFLKSELKPSFWFSSLVFHFTTLMLMGIDFSHLWIFPAANILSMFLQNNRSFARNNAWISRFKSI